MMMDSQVTLRETRDCGGVAPGAPDDNIILSEIVLPATPTRAKKIRIKLGRLFVTAKVDPGAEISVISERACERVMAKDPTLCMRRTSLRVRHAGGQRLLVLGEIQLPVCANTYHTEHTFLVIKELPANVLIGEDFWAKHCSSQEYDRPVIPLKDGTLLPYWRDEEENSSYVHTLEKTTINSQHAQEVLVRAEDLPPGYSCVFYPPPENVLLHASGISAAG